MAGLGAGKMQDLSLAPASKQLMVRRQVDEKGVAKVFPLLIKESQYKLDLSKKIFRWISAIEVQNTCVILQGIVS
jgi:hypothetical protein